MRSIMTTPIACSVHRAGQSPIYGEQATNVLVEDDAGGPYIVLRQSNDHVKPGEVRLDLDELEAVVVAARAMIKAHEAAA